MRPRQVAFPSPGSRQVGPQAAHAANLLCTKSRRPNTGHERLRARTDRRLTHLQLLAGAQKDHSPFETGTHARDLHREQRRSPRDHVDRKRSVIRAGSRRLVHRSSTSRRLRYLLIEPSVPMTFRSTGHSPIIRLRSMKRLRPAVRSKLASMQQRNSVRPKPSSDDPSVWTFFFAKPRSRVSSFASTAPRASSILEPAPCLSTGPPRDSSAS